MLKSQKISIELSGVRSDLLDDELDSDKRNELVTKYQDLESRHAARLSPKAETTRRTTRQPRATWFHALT